jgi:hypothetical protein
MANGFIIPTNLQLNLGKYPNDGTGDDLYTAFDKIRQTLNLINSQLGVIDGENIGTGQGVYSAKVDNKLQFKKITGVGSVTVTSTSNTISIAAGSNVQSDTAPSLGGNLFLNGKNIIGAGSPGVDGAGGTINDIRSTIWGLDVRSLQNQINALTTNFGNLDLGSNWASTLIDNDLGPFQPIATP